MRARSTGRLLGTSACAVAAILAGNVAERAVAQTLAGTVDRLATQRSCPGCDLIGADLTGLHDLSGADLSGSDLSFADLSSMLFSSTGAEGPADAARFSGAVLERAFLHDGWFAHVDFSGIHAPAALFSRSTLLGVRFEGANLVLADFAGVGAADASFSGAMMEGAILAGADLGDANLLGTDLRLADLTDADLSGARYAPGGLDGALLCRTVLANGALADRDCVDESDFAADGMAGCDLYRSERHAGLTAFWTGGCMEGNRADDVGAARYYRDGAFVEAFFGEVREGFWISGFTARYEEGSLVLDDAGRFVRNQLVLASADDSVGIVEAFQNGLTGLNRQIEAFKAEGNLASAALYQDFADRVATVRPRFD